MPTGLPIDADLRSRIAAAPLTQTNGALATELGLHWRTVQAHRAAMRREAEEAARGLRAEHTRSHVVDALQDLDDARRIFRARYEEAGSAQVGRLWLESIRVTLTEVAPDPRGMSDDELRQALIDMAERLGQPLSITVAVQQQVQQAGAPNRVLEVQSGETADVPER